MPLLAASCEPLGADCNLYSLSMSNYNYNPNQQMEHSEGQPDNFRPTSLYAALACSLILLIIGVVIIVKGIVAAGYLPSGRGMGAGKFGAITGWGVIFLSILLGAFPVYYLRKQR